MTVQLSSLRISTEFDSSGYTAGMARKVSADQAGAASSDQVGAALGRQDVAMEAAGGAAGRLSRTYIDGYGSGARFGQALASLQRQLELGNVTAERASLIYRGMTDRFGMVASSAEVAARGNADFAKIVTGVNATVNTSVVGLAATGEAATLSALKTRELMTAMERMAMGVGSGTVSLTSMSHEALMLVRALGESGGVSAAFRMVGATVLEFALNPVTWVVVGFTAAIAAAGALFSLIGSSGASAANVLKQHGETLSQIKSLWDKAGDAAEKYGSRVQEAIKFAGRQNASDLQASLADQLGQATAALQHGLGASPSLPARIQGTPFDSIVKSLEAGKLSVIDFTTAIQRVGNRDTDFADLGAEILKVTDGALKAADAMKELGIETAKMAPPSVMAGIAASWDSTNKAYADNVVAIIDQVSNLKFEEDQLKRTATQQAVFTELKKLGITSIDGHSAALQDEINLLIKETDQYEKLKAAMAGITTRPGPLTPSPRDAETASMAAYGTIIGLPGEAQTKKINDVITALKFQHDQLGRNAEQQKLYEELQAAGVGLDTKEGQAIAALVQKNYDLQQAKKETLNFQKDFIDATDKEITKLQAQAATLGLGTGAIAAQTKEMELLNLAREKQAEFDLAGNKQTVLTPARIAAIHAEAVAFGEVTTELAKQKIASDIAYQSDLLRLNLSDKEMAIASQLRSLYGNDIPRALNSSEAAGLRFVERLKEVHTLGVSIKDSLGSALAGAFSGATKTGAAFLDAMTSVIAQAASKFLATRITDALFGGDPAAAVNNSSKVAAAALDTSASHLVQAGPVLANAAAALNGAASNLAAAGHGIAAGATTAPGSVLGGAASAYGITAPAAISSSAITSLTGSLAQAANAIASIESQGSGGYSARGPVTGSGDRAYGRYQVMGANIPSWTQQALGQSLSASQFLANPQAQDAVFQKIFGGLVTKYGNMSDAASAWFTGRPLAQGANASDVNGMTGSGYVARFNRAMASGTSGNGALSVNVASVGGTTISGAGGVAGLNGSPSAANANATGIGGFLKSAAGQAAIAGFSIGYQQQDPLGGALTGAASGYQSGGVKGGVVGAIGGLIGGFLGAAQAAHDAQQKAIQAWNGMAGQVIAFGQAMEGTSGGSLTSSLTQVRDQTQKFADAAKAAGVNYQFLNQEFADFATRQIRNFVSSFDVMIEALDQGLGANSPAVSAAQNVLAVGDTLKAFVVDTQTAVAAMSGQQQPAGPTTKNSFFFGSTTSAASTAQPILPTAAQSSAVAAAQKAAQDYAVSLLQTPPALTAVQTSLLSLRGAAAQLGNVLQDLGMSATDAAQAVQTGVNQALDKIKSDFSSALQDKINSVTGQSYVTDLNNLIKEAVGMLGDAQSLGLDQTPVAIYFQAAAQAIIDNAGVVGTSFDLLKARFPSLTGVVHAATASLDSFATSIADFLASIKVGSLSPLSPLAQLNAAQSTYDTTFASAKGGDSTAMGKITNVAQTFLQAAQSYFASSPNYAAVFSKITTDLATLPQLLGSSKTAAQLLGSVAATSGNANFVLTNNLPDVNKATDATAGATDATATSTDSAAQTLVILQGIQDVTKTASVDISNSVVALGKVTQGIATVTSSEYFGPMVNSLSAIQEYTRITANNAGKQGRGGGLLGGILGLLSIFLFEKGGWVPGANTGTDSVPALLTPGEFVLSKKHAAVLAPLLNGIHSGGGDALAGMNASPSLGPTITPALSLTGSNDNGRHFENLGSVISANFNTQNRILAAHHQAFADMADKLDGLQTEIRSMKQQQSIDAKRPTVPGRKATA